MGYLKLTLTTTCLVHSLSSEGAEAGASTAGLARSVAASGICTEVLSMGARHSVKAVGRTRACVATMQSVY